jgi:hypothetical protein
MGINRIKLQAGSPAEMAAAQKAKTSDPALDAIRQQLFGQNYIQDIGRGQGIAQYYSGFGLPASLQFTQPAVATTTPAVATSAPAVGTGGGGQATNFNPVSTLINTGGGITNVDTPLTQMITDPVTGQTQTVRQAMTSDAAYRGTPSSPFLASGAAGGARLPTTPIGPRTTLPSGDVFATDDPMLQEKIDYTQDPEGFGNRVKTALSEGKNLVTEFGQGVFDQISKLKDQGIDLGKMAGKTLANAILPGLSIATDLLPKRDLRQNKLDDLYDVKDGTIQSGLMKGYNPVSGGGLYTLTGGKAGTPPTYGLQDAYGKRIDTIENTLKDKYNMSDAEIADVKAGSYKGDVDTNLLDRLVDLEDAKKKEADVLGIPDADIDSGRGSGLRPTVDDATGVNPFADIDTGAGEFDVAPITGPQPGITNPRRPGQDVATLPDDITLGPVQPGITNPRRPGISTPAAKGPPGQLNPANPSDRASIVDRAKEIGLGDVETHLANNSKLEKAAQAGIIDKELYNELGGYDVTQNITGGSEIPSAALNAIVGTGRNIGQAILGEQDFAGIPATTIDNTQGALGFISQDKKNIHNAIINGDPYTDEGVAAIKNQIEMSRYQDPIMGMVNQNILADDTINRMTDDVDLDLFDTTPTEYSTTRPYGIDAVAKPTDPDPFGTDVDIEQGFTGPGAPPTGVGSPFEYMEPDLDAIDLGNLFDDPRIPSEEEGLIADKAMARAAAERQAQAEQAAQRARDEAAARAREEAAARARDEAAAARAREEAARKAQERMNQRDDPAPARKTPSAPVYQDAIMRGQTGGGSDPGCFIKGTLITMADKTTKPVEQVDLEDEVAVGGKVFAVGKFLNTELYDYKGIKVSGSHMVNEEGVWMRVRDTKHGKSLGDDKHTVYVFGSENRRILINGILFTDYFEVKDQEKLLKYEDKFFDNWRSYSKNEDINNVNTLNAS